MAKVVLVDKPEDTPHWVHLNRCRLVKHPDLARVGEEVNRKGVLTDVEISTEKGGRDQYGNRPSKTKGNIKSPIVLDTLNTM